MRIAITGGTGFIGSHLAYRLLADGHDVVVVGRGPVERATDVVPGTTFRAADITDAVALKAAFVGCDAVAHCAGINREIGRQTYARVHVAGTRAVVSAASSSGVARLALVSHLRARPDGPSEYHRSKWRAEEIVRGSSLAWTVLKCGVTYGKGDEMLDHLSRSFHTLPVFGLVGLRDQAVRPVAVDDVVRVLAAAVTGDDRLRRRTVEVLGPDTLALGDAIRRVATVVGRRPVFVRVPVAAELIVARVAEMAMHEPLVSVAQVHILAESGVVPLPAADQLPLDLAPRTPFDNASIRAGLPAPGGFSLHDLRCSRLGQEG